MLWLYLTISLHEIEEMSSWNGEALRVELAAVADVDIDLLAFTAFSTEEIDVILDPAKDVTKPNPDDALPAPLPKTVTRAGDVWCFDKGHRLVCGDTLDPEVYRKLMGGALPRLVIADPPYNEKIAGHVSGRRGAREFATASGEMTPAQFTGFLTGAFRLAAQQSPAPLIAKGPTAWQHFASGKRCGRIVELLETAAALEVQAGGDHAQ